MRRRLADLPTLAEQRAKRPILTKPHTRLERAIAKKAARLLDGRKLTAWAMAVKTRDQWKDRKTGHRVHGTRALDPDRAESHHVEPKANKVTRYDVRNGICLSLQTHDDVERGVYRIEGTAWFIGSDGQRYIDATHPVIFVRL